MLTPIIENILPKDYEAQLSKFEQSIDRLITKAEKLNTSFSSDKASELSKTLEQLSLEETKLATAQEKLTQEQSKSAIQQERLIQAQMRTTQMKERGTAASVEEKVAIQAETQAKTENAKATVAAVGAYANLIAQYNIAKKEVLDLAAAGTTQGQAFETATARANSLKLQLDKIHSTTGLVGKGFNNAAFQIYGFTQLLQDMPNFLISTRTGFMAISNNITIAMQGLENIAKSTITVRDELGNLIEKQAGYGYAIKQMVGSIFTLQGAFIAISAIMLLLTNKQFTDWIKKITQGSEAADSLSTKMGLLNEVMKAGGAKSKISEVMELGVVLQSAAAGTYDAKTAVEKYNETLGVNYGKVNSVTEAIQGYIEYSDQYISATIAMAAASTVLNAAADSFIKKQESLTSLKHMDNIKELDAAYLSIVKTAKQTKGGMEELYNLLGKPWGFVNLTSSISPIHNKVDALSSSVERLSKMKGGTEYLKEMYKLSEANNTINSAKETAKSFYEEIPKAFTKGLGKQAANNVVQVQKDIIEKLDYYNELRGQMEMDLVNLEDKMNKVSSDNIENSYKDRLEAAKQYYAKKDLIAQDDLTKAQHNADEELKKDQSKIIEQSKLLEQKNAKSKNGDVVALDYKVKIGKEEYSLTKNLYDALGKADENHRRALKDANDKYNLDLLNNQQALKQKVLSIKADEYKDEVQLMQISEDKKNALLKQSYEKQKNALENLSPSEIIASAFGYEKDIALETQQAEYAYNNEKLQNEIDFINKKLSLDTISAEERENLEIELTKTINEQDNLREESAIASAKIIRDKILSTYKGIASTIKETVKTTIDSMQEVMNTSLDNELDKYKTTKNEELDSLEKMHDKGAISDAAYQKKKVKIEDEITEKEKEIEKKQEKLKKEAFLLEQAISLAGIWFSYSKTVGNYTAAQSALSALLTPTMLVGAPAAAAAIYEPLKMAALKSAVSQTALIAAQSIPYFAEGGALEVGKIRRRQNISPRPNGDNLLVYANTKETIVNDSQIDKIGRYRFRLAGVPGYENIPIPHFNDYIPNSTIFADKDRTINVDAGFSDEQIRETNRLLRELLNKKNKPTLMEMMHA